MKQKKILVVYNGYPVGNSTGDKIRVLNMVQSLSNIGYDVYLVGYFTRGWKGIFKEKKHVLKNVAHSLFFTLPKRFILGDIASIFQSLHVRLLIKRYKIDAVQLELSNSVAAAKFLPDNVKVITDFHSDLVPEFKMRKFSNYKIQSAIKENFLSVKKSDATITVSQNLHGNLSHYGALDNNYIMPCNFDTKLFSKIEDEDQVKVRKQLGISNDKIVLCYLGGLHVWQCFDQTLDLMYDLCQLNPMYHICIFTNDNMDAYKDKVDLLKDRITIKSLQKDEIPTYLSIINVGFVLRENSLVNINSSPTKTAEYLAAGAFVVATQFSGDAPELIETCRNGIVLENLELSKDVVEKINAGIIRYKKESDLRAQYAKKNIFKCRSWDLNESKLKRLYENIFM